MCLIMSILDPNYPIYSMENTIREFKSTIDGIKRRNQEYQQERIKFEKTNKHQNRCFLRQKIIFRLRRFYEQK